MSGLGWVAFVVAGAAGAVARFLLDGAVSRRFRGDSTRGTFAVNASGCFLFGVLTGLTIYQEAPRWTRLVLGVGFCGAYTTFSTFTLEVVRLADVSGPGAASRYALGTLAAATALAGAGLGIAGLL